MNNTRNCILILLIRISTYKLKDELFNLRFQHTINQLENPMRINAVKKDIARIKTIMTELDNEK